MAEAEGNDLESKIVEVMSQHPKGLSHPVLKQSLTSVKDDKLIVEILNKLLKQHKIQLLKRGNELVYKLKEEGSTQQYQGSDLEEKVVFEAIGRAKNDGVAPVSLKSQCNLAPARITKILKTLESKRLIKSVTSKSRKKLYMLYELEPSHDITGGIFYSDKEFDSEFVDVLAEQCYRYLVQAKAVAEKHSDPISQRNGSFKSLKDVCDFINESNISKAKLSQKHIEKILESLIYDDKVEKSFTMSKTHTSKESGTETLYCIKKPLISSAGIMMVPCGVCPVYQDCHVGGDVSPATCVYLKQWLDF